MYKYVHYEIIVESFLLTMEIINKKNAELMNGK